MLKDKLSKLAFIFTLAVFAVSSMAIASYSPSSDPAYGEMYIADNAVETVIDTASAVHMLHGLFIAGANKHWTFAAGVKDDDITAFATYDTGNSTLITTTSTHELSANEYISIVGTTNYNAMYKVLSAPSTTTFEINKAWDGNDDAQGTFIRGDSLTANGQSAGAYSGEHYTSATSAVNNEIFEFFTIVNGTKCAKCIAKRKFGISGDYGSMGGGAIATPMEIGTVIQFGVENIGSTGNLTIQYGNVKPVRL